MARRSGRETSEVRCGTSGKIGSRSGARQFETLPVGSPFANQQTFKAPDTLAAFSKKKRGVAGDGQICANSGAKSLARIQIRPCRSLLDLVTNSRPKSSWQNGAIWQEKALYLKLVLKELPDGILGDIVGDKGPADAFGQDEGQATASDFLVLPDVVHQLFRGKRRTWNRRKGDRQTGLAQMLLHALRIVVRRKTKFG